MPKKRKPPKLKPLKTLRIFCEGECTEPNYLKGYIAALDNTSRKTVVEVQKTRKNTAVQLVEEAVKAKGSADSLPEDEFWVVYDREAVAKYSDQLHAEARALAKRAGISIALCNVCFEYWLLIHFVTTTAPYSSYDDLIAKSALRSKIKAVAGKDYEKSMRSIFDLLKGSVSDARTRAIKLNASGVANAAPGRDAPHQINPYVGIVDLLDAIDKFA
ncbi:MAG: RloB family protein [Sphingomonadales bacterium]|jgi:hypothetical protein